MSKWLLTSLEIALNRVLPLDPIGEQRLIALEGRSISFSVSEPTLEGTLYFESGQVVALANTDPKANTTVSSTVKNLIKLFFDTSGSPVGSGVQITGDQQLLLTLQDIIKSLDIDIEEPLSKFIGDIPAQQIGQTARTLFNWAKKAQGAL